MSYDPYYAIGFDEDDFTDLDHYLKEEFGASDYETDFYDNVVSHQDESGVRVSVFDSNLGHPSVVAFSTGKPLIASAYRVIDHLILVQLRRPGQGPEGEVYNQVAASTDEAFHLPPGNPVGGEALFTDKLELSAWGLEYSLFDDVAQWREQGVATADGSATPDTIVPEVLYSESVERFHKDFNPRRVTPIATLAAEITAVERRTNGITGTDFYVCDVNLPTGTLALILPARDDSPEPAAGNVFAGTAFVSATVGYWQSRYESGEQS